MTLNIFSWYGLQVKPTQIFTVLSNEDLENFLDILYIPLGQDIED